MALIRTSSIERLDHQRGRSGDPGPKQGPEGQLVALLVCAIEALLPDRQLIVRPAALVLIEHAHQRLRAGQLARQHGERGHPVGVHGCFCSVRKIISIPVRGAHAVLVYIDLGRSGIAVRRDEKGNPVVARKVREHRGPLVGGSRIELRARLLPAREVTSVVCVGIRLPERIDWNQAAGGLGIHITKRGVGESPLISADLLLIDLGGDPGAGAHRLIDVGRRGFAISRTAIGAVVNHDAAAVGDGDIGVCRQPIDAIIERAIDRVEGDGDAVVIFGGDDVVQGRQRWERGLNSGDLADDPGIGIQPCIEKTTAIAACVSARVRPRARILIVSCI